MIAGRVPSSATIIEIAPDKRMVFTHQPLRLAARDFRVSLCPNIDERRDIALRLRAARAELQTMDLFTDSHSGETELPGASLIGEANRPVETNRTGVSGVAPWANDGYGSPILPGRQERGKGDPAAKAATPMRDGAAAITFEPGRPKPRPLNHPASTLGIPADLEPVRCLENSVRVTVDDDGGRLGGRRRRHSRQAGRDGR